MVDAAISSCLTSRKLPMNVSVCSIMYYWLSMLINKIDQSELCIFHVSVRKPAREWKNKNLHRFLFVFLKLDHACVCKKKKSTLCPLVPYRLEYLVCNYLVDNPGLNNRHEQCTWVDSLGLYNSYLDNHQNSVYLQPQRDKKKLCWQCD